MSLLNDALRKKSREQKEPGAVNLFQDGPPPLQRGKGKKYGIFALIFIACVVVIWMVWPLIFQPRTSIIRPQIVGNIIIEPEPEAPVFNTDQPQVPQETPHPAEPARPASLAMVAPSVEKTPAPPISSSPIEPSKKEKKRPNVQERQKPAPSSGSEEPFYLKALSYHRRNELGKAIQMYQEVLRKNPEHSDALFNLASAYLKTSSYAEAYNIVQKLHELDPENPRILLNLAIAEIGLGRPQEAIFCLDNADALDNRPQFEIYFHKGVALSKLDKLKEAEIWYRKAEKLNPDHPRLIFNMAVVYDKLLKYDAALKYYGAFLENENAPPSQEKTEVENRIKAIKVYMAGQSSG